VSPGAGASRNEANEILNAYLVNGSAYIEEIWIKMIYSRIKEKWRESDKVNDQ